MPKKNQNILYPVAFIFSFFIALAGLGMAVGEGEAGAADSVPVVSQEGVPGTAQEDAAAPTLTRAQQRELDRQAEDAAQLAQAIADERCFNAPRALRDECDTAVAENRAALAEARMAAAILTGNCRALPTGREERECREQVEANQAVIDAELSAALYEEVAPLLENQVFVNAVYAPRWQVTGQRAHGGCWGANANNETCNRNHQHSHALIFSHNENLTAEVTLENNRVRVRIPGGVAIVREFLENEDIATVNTMTGSSANQVVVTS